MTESCLGRGFEPIAGKPFGWAWNRERDEIREHLKKRGRWTPGYGEFLVSKIQQRLNREHPKRWKARQDAWRARQPAAKPAPIEELIAALREIAAGHNDARGRAAEALEKAGLA